MGKLITLQRDDGSLFQVDESEAAHYGAVGFKEESEASKTSRAIKDGEDRYYESTGQKIKTAIEGAGSGITLGLSDKLLELGTDEGVTGSEWRNRAEHNPGTRLAAELVGAIAPAIVSGGQLTPVGLLSEGANLASAGVKGAVKRGIVKGGVEGAGFGLGAEISNSALSGDPLTVEGALAGMGWGAVFGGGLGAIGGKIEARMADKAAVQAAAEAKVASRVLPEEKWGTFRAGIREAGDRSEIAFKSAGEHLEAVGNSAKSAVKEAGEIRNTVFNEGWTEDIGMARKEKKAAIAAYNEMKSALAEKDWAGLQTASERFNKSLEGMSEVKAGFSHLHGEGSAPIAPPSPFMASKVPHAALDQLKDMGVIGKTLKTFAETPAAFSGMGTGTFNKMTGALDKFLALPASEFAGAQEGIRQSITALAEHVGIVTEGAPTTQLRKVWETLKAANKPGAAEKAIGKTPWLTQAATTAVGAGVSSATHSGWLGYNAGKALANSVLGVKGAVLGAISGATSAWEPRAGALIKYAGSKAEPLAVRLNGTMDEQAKTKSKQELMKERMKEISEAAPRLKDTLYKGVQGMDIHHPEFAAELHRTAVEQFKFLYNKLPRDPGNAFNRMETLHTPDPVQTEKFSRYYEAFQNPVQVMTDGLNGKRVSAESAEGVREMWPAVWTHFRVGVLERLSDPALMKSLNYQDQVQIGLLTGLQIHSSMTPQFVVQQQQMFQQRAQPLQMQAQTGAPGASGGRPGNSKSATPAQISTER